MSITMKTLVFLLAVAGLTSAFPTNYWGDSSYMNKVRLQQNTGQQCTVSRTAAIVCQSARVTVEGRHSHVHVCPVDGKQPNGVCVNSKLPTCCDDRSQLENSGFECVSTTKLTVSSSEVNVKIYKNDQGEHCIFFDDPDIGRCCPAATRVLTCPEVPTVTPCKMQRDVYFVLDTTSSIGEELFCRFGYVIQLMVEAINPGKDTETRVAGVLYGSVETGFQATDLFSVDDGCDDIVSKKLTRLIYEYYAIGNTILTYDQVVYKNVQAKSTKAYAPLKKVEDHVKAEKRNSSIIILTDGRNSDEVEFLRDRLVGETDVLIAAGIGPAAEITEEDLAKLAPAENVIYESNTSKVFDFSRRIVQKMNQEGALCTDEATRILKAIENTNDIDVYCSKTCLFNSNPTGCTVELPSCEDERLAIQTIDARVMSAKKDFNEETLKEKILAAVEEVIEKVEEKKYGTDREEYMRWST